MRLDNTIRLRTPSNSAQSGERIMLLHHAGLTVALMLFGLSASPREAAAQTSGSRQRLAQTIPFDCLDRCFAEFKTCLGTPPRGDLMPLPNGRGEGVPTLPPFDLCKRARDECDAQCIPPARR
jgi:hypothetical protein